MVRNWNDVFVNSRHKTFNKDVILSLEDYLTHIEHLQDMWNPDALWFRGVSSSSYFLVPGFYRQFNNLNQVGARDLFDSFIRRGKAFTRSGSYTRWHWYHIMQHYGLPTRLLDWTEGALIALLFALRHRSSSVPSVWVLNPYWLNEMSTGKGVVYYTDEILQTNEDKIANEYQ